MMSPPSFLRTLLALIYYRRGRAGIKHTAECYLVPTDGSDAQLTDAIVQELEDNGNRFVLDGHAWDLSFWNEVLVEHYGVPAVDDLDDAVGLLAMQIDHEARRNADDTGTVTIEANAHEDGTAYPAFEELSTDAVLPWVRTGLVPFQRQAAQRVFDHIYKNGQQTALLCLPEGAGKVRTALDVALGACVARDKRVLWVGRSRELLDLVHEEIRELAWLVGKLGAQRPLFSVSRFGSRHRNLDGDLVLTSDESLADEQVDLQRLESAGPISLICVDDARLWADESRLGSISSLLSDEVRVLGLTGTPVTVDEAGSATLLQVFGDEPAFRRTFKDLVEARFLSRPVFVRKRLGSAASPTVDPLHLQRMIEGKADLPPSLVSQIVRSEARLREMLGHWLDHRARYGRTIAFAHDTEHAARLRDWLGAHGVSADVVHPGLPHVQRSQRLDRFRRNLTEVLVVAGLMTEGEHVPDVQTILIARPTLDVSLYKQMVGYGARRLAPPLGKTHFFVLDFIDDLEPYGVSPAGRAAAIDVGSDFEDTSTVLAPTQVPDRGPVIERALVSVRAWQIVRRFADEQYTIWGELSWRLSEGGEKSIIAFHEGIARLRFAVDLIEASLPLTDLEPLIALGAELDWLGAIRQASWEQLLSDCAQTGQAPWLEKIDDPTLSESGEACAHALAQLVEDVLSNRTSLPAAMTRCAVLVADEPAVRAHFSDVVALRREILTLYHDAADHFDLARMDGSDRGQPLIDAFIQLTVGLALADRVLHDAEVRSIEKAVARIFDIHTTEQREWVHETLSRHVGLPPDALRAAESVQGLATRAELFNIYDWLFRIAFADGVFADEEQQFLRAAADALGIPAEEYDELSLRYTASLTVQSREAPASVEVIPYSMQEHPRLRFCTACGYPRPSEATFCVSCGAELRSEIV